MSHLSRSIFNALTYLAGLQVVGDVLAHLGPVVMCLEFVEHLAELKMTGQKGDHGRTISSWLGGTLVGRFGGCGQQIPCATHC